MKLPEIPKRKPKDAASAGSGGIKAPDFLQDLYKDMRDRRLIIPAVALLVAIVSLPVVLGSSGEEPVASAPPLNDAGAIAVEPAVLATQEVGVRDYRKRLDDLKRKNPFGDKFAPKPVDPTAGLEDAVAVDTSSAPSSDIVTEPVRADTVDAGPAPGPSAPSEPFVLVPRVNVEVGIVDRDRRRNIAGVKSGDMLPSKQTPVALYMGNSDDGSRAAFLVSRDVSKVNGDGECKPKRTDCEFLELGDGENAYLRYEDGKRYKLRVTEIYFKRIPESRFDQSE